MNAKTKKVKKTLPEDRTVRLEGMKNLVVMLLRQQFPGASEKELYVGQTVRAEISYRQHSTRGGICFTVAEHDPEASCLMFPLKGPVRAIYLLYSGQNKRIGGKPFSPSWEQQVVEDARAEALKEVST